MKLNQPSSPIKSIWQNMGNHISLAQVSNAFTKQIIFLQGRQCISVLYVCSFTNFQVMYIIIKNISEMKHMLHYTTKLYMNTY